jgi:hypothetical protein
MTTPVTHSIAKVGGRLVTITASIIHFSKSLADNSWLGLGNICTGLTWYAYMKTASARNRKAADWSVWCKLSVYALLFCSSAVTATNGIQAPADTTQAYLTNYLAPGPGSQAPAATVSPLFGQQEGATHTLEEPKQTPAGPILLYWWGYGSAKHNLGDDLNPQLVKYLSGQEVKHARVDRDGVLLAVGSVLGNDVKTATATHVWGTGIIAEHGWSQRCSKDAEIRFSAVRGPLTRDQVVASGCDVPKVFGDPALLTPLMYNPGRTAGAATVQLCVVPHYIDHRNQNYLAFRSSLKRQSEISVKFLNIATDKFEEYVDAMMPCQVSELTSVNVIAPRSMALSIAHSLFCYFPRTP